MLFLIPTLAVVASVSLWLVLGRPRFLPAAADPPEEARISIIIPARDEEENLGGLLDSITRQDLAPHEIIVVDDGSVDRTAALAGERGARVVGLSSLPDGWKGKPWACQQGARAATGNWFLFVDADTRMEPGAMRKIAGLTRFSGRAFSICPYHRIRNPSEELSAFFNVIMLAGVNAFGIQSEPSKGAALFGQCLLISRSDYEGVGGHALVREEILENFHLASHLESRGVARDCFLGKGSMTMRMFPAGFPELWASWKKGFTSGAKQAAPRALILVSIWITGAMLALGGLALALTPSVPNEVRLASAAVYPLYVAQCCWAFRLAGNFSVLNAVFFPVSLLFYQTLFFTALAERALGLKTPWKGRHVD